MLILVGMLLLLNVFKTKVHGERRSVNWLKVKVVLLTEADMQEDVMEEDVDRVSEVYQLQHGSLEDAVLLYGLDVCKDVVLLQKRLKLMKMVMKPLLTKHLPQFKMHLLPPVELFMNYENNVSGLCSLTYDPP